MSWDEILGQDEPKRMLQADLRAGTVAGAYLLAGPEGIGKRRLAMEMAKALVCERRGADLPPCDACPVCRQVTRLTHPDVHVLEPGGASRQIRLEAVRQLLARLALRPFSACVQVAVVDGVDRLTDEAANSLLKLLEEPPASARWLLITSALGRCLPTVVSRCRLVRLRRLSQEMVERLLTADGRAEAADVRTIARLAQGSASRAGELAEHWPAWRALIERCATFPTERWLTEPMPDSGETLRPWLEGLMQWVRDVAVVSAWPAVWEEPGFESAGWVLHHDQRAALTRQAQAVDPDRCLRVVEQLAALRESLEQFVSPRLVAALARETWLSLVMRDAP